MFIQPHDPDFMPEPIYPEYIPLEDEHIPSAEEQPLPHVGSPTAESPGYVAESDPEEDPEEYEDGPVDYPMDGGDDGDDDDGDSSGDNADDKDEDEEEEEHLAPADSVVVIPTDELVSPPEGTEPIIPPPSTDTITTGARITVRLPTAISFPPEAERLCLSTLGSRYEVGESSTARPTRGQGIDYGFVSTLDAELRRRGIGEVGYALPPVVSPTAESPEYVAESDPEEDLEEYEDDETEDGLVDYPMDGGDDDDGDSSRDNADDEDEDEEHLAPADFAVVIPTDKLVSPPERTEPAEVERLLAMHTPSPSLHASLSPPSAGERLARSMAPYALPLPPPLYMPPPVYRRDDIPETEMPPHKRLCLSTLGSRDTWIDPTETVPNIAPMTVGEVNTRVTELVVLHERDTRDLYALLEDAQDSRTRVSKRVAVDSQRVDLLMEDMIAHQETIQIVKDEAYAAREAWAHSIGLSQAVHSELQTHQEQMQQTEIAELRETDRRRQAQMVETLRVMGDMRREMGDMQAELLALRGQPRRAGQPGRDARVPNHQNAPRDADSHI
nr:hypothetical protein [Tanacetum cinerariifolium]